MDDRRRLRRDADDDRERSPAAKSEPHERQAADPVLDLQRRAGNRAVAAMLGTNPAPAAPASVQREPRDGGARPEPADTGAGTKMSISIPELKLTMPIVSFSDQSSQRRRRPEGRRGEEDTSGEAMVIVDMKDLDPRIHRHVVEGTHFESITIKVGRLTIVAHDVFLSSFNVGQDSATISLSFGSSKTDFGPKPEDGGADDPR